MMSNISIEINKLSISLKIRMWTRMWFLFKVRNYANQYASFRISSSIESVHYIGWVNLFFAKN